MPALRTGFFIALISSSPWVLAQSASTAEQQINAWLAQHPPVTADHPIAQQARVLSSAQQLNALCAEPQWHSVGGAPRLTGKRTLSAQCGNRRSFIQIEVQAQGSWYVAARSLAAGETLRENDVQRVSGSLASLPAGALLQQQAILGRVTLRAIAPGQTLAQSQLRQSWRVRQGQQVEMTAEGRGFRLRSKGTALNNAAIGQTVGVKTASGQRVQGTVTADGTILLAVQ